MNLFQRWQVRGRKHLRRDIAKGRRYYIWHYGVLRWGVPVALFTAVLPWRGFSYLASAEFGVDLVFSLLFKGVGGGYVFGIFMWNMVKDTPLDVPEDELPSALPLAEGFARGVISAPHLYATVLSTTLFFGLLLSPYLLGSEYAMRQVGVILFGAITACGVLWLVRRRLSWRGAAVVALAGGGALAFLSVEPSPAEPALSVLAVLAAAADLALGVYGLNGTYANMPMLLRSPGAERPALGTPALRRAHWLARGAYALMLLNACIILTGLWAITTGRGP